MKEQNLEQSLDAVLSEAKAIQKIKNEKDYHAIGEILVNIKEKKQRVVEFFKDTKKKTYDAWQSVVGQEKSFLKKLNEADAIARRLARDYEIEQEKKREEERIKQIVEQQKKKEEAKLEADSLAISGNIEEATKKLEEAEKPILTVVEPSQKPPTIRYRDAWEITTVDELTLIKEALKNPRWMGFIKVDHGAIKSFVNKTKGQVEVPGVSFKATKIPVI